MWSSHYYHVTWLSQLLQLCPLHKAIGPGAQEDWISHDSGTREWILEGSSDSSQSAGSRHGNPKILTHSSPSSRGWNNSNNKTTATYPLQDGAATSRQTKQWMGALHSSFQLKAKINNICISCFWFKFVCVFSGVKMYIYLHSILRIFKTIVNEKPTLLWSRAFAICTFFLTRLPSALSWLFASQPWSILLHSSLKLLR